ncbi:MAG: ribosome biogenesis GTP-binding protein YihA/YsxC [Syntrophobacteraceae bacterium]
MHSINSPLIIKSAEFVKSAFEPGHYPPDDLPEVAFAGRSNVGKSSLINSLVQRKKLVRTSNTPGQTQSINFFNVNGAFHFVDLPGYGFARVPEKIRALWKPMVETYIERRKSLRGIVQIIDTRHPPTPEDLQLWNWLRARGTPVLAVLTKTDKVKRALLDSLQRRAAASLGILHDEIIPFSAITQQGRELILEKLQLWLFD